MGQLKLTVGLFDILNSKMTWVIPFPRAQNISHTDSQTDFLNSRAGKGLTELLSPKEYIYCYPSVVQKSKLTRKGRNATQPAPERSEQLFPKHRVMPTPEVENYIKCRSLLCSLSSIICLASVQCSFFSMYLVLG